MHAVRYLVEQLAGKVIRQRGSEGIEGARESGREFVLDLVDDGLADPCSMRRLFEVTRLDLESDTAYRVSRAYIDTLSGNFQAVIQWLGRVRDVWRNVPPVRPARFTISSVSVWKLSELS